MPTDRADLEALLRQLDAQASTCLLDADFHAWRGAVLLSTGRVAPAIEALERALLIDPDLPGAQLDYAQALIAIGDRTAARALLEQISSRPDLPPSLQRLVRQELAATDASAWRVRWTLASALGWDSNLNNAPAASELTLTFPQGPVTLPLADSGRPQQGGAWLNSALWQAVRPSARQLWLLQAELRVRHSAQSSARYQQADLSASWLQDPEAPRQWVVRAGAGRIDFGGQQLLQSGRASMQHQWQGSAPPWLGGGDAQCRPGLGLEGELRRYPVTTELNGRYVGATAAFSCLQDQRSVAETYFNRQSLNLQLRWGEDRPDRVDRPGGRYRRTELRVLWEGRRGPYKLGLDYGFAQQKDAAGYSPLLADNLARTLGRHSVRLELSRPLAASWAEGAEWFASIEASRQHSNLQAFASRQAAVYSGLRWSR